MNHERFAWRSDAGPPPGTVFFLVLATVIGGAILLVQLYPFDFASDASAPFLGLVYGGVGSVLGHAVLFVPLGVVEAALARRFMGRSGPLVLLVVTIDAVLLGLICEAGQHWLPARSSSMIDLCANTIGAVAGYLVLTTCFDGGRVAP